MDLVSLSTQAQKKKRTGARCDRSPAFNCRQVDPRETKSVKLIARNRANRPLSADCFAIACRQWDTRLLLTNAQITSKMSCYAGAIHTGRSLLQSQKSLGRCWRSFTASLFKSRSPRHAYRAFGSGLAIRFCRYSCSARMPPFGPGIGRLSADRSDAAPAPWIVS